MTWLERFREASQKRRAEEISRGVRPVQLAPRTAIALTVAEVQELVPALEQVFKRPIDAQSLQDIYTTLANSVVRPKGYACAFKFHDLVILPVSVLKPPATLPAFYFMFYSL